MPLRRAPPLSPSTSSSPNEICTCAWSGERCSGCGTCGTLKLTGRIIPTMMHNACAGCSCAINVCLAKPGYHLARLPESWLSDCAPPESLGHRMCAGTDVVLLLCPHNDPPPKVAPTSEIFWVMGAYANCTAETHCRTITNASVP